MAPGSPLWQYALVSGGAVLVGGLLRCLFRPRIDEPGAPYPLLHKPNCLRAYQDRMSGEFDARWGPNGLGIDLLAADHTAKDAAETPDARGDGSGDAGPAGERKPGQLPPDRRIR